MKFLLFFVSLIFSIIFYSFHNLSVGKGFFLNSIPNSASITSFSGKLLIESFIFLFIGMLFVYIFSDFKGKGNTKLGQYKLEIIYFVFYVIFTFYIYFFNNIFNVYVIFLIVFFISSDLLFNHISNIVLLSKYRIKLRYVGLIINYIISLVGIFYIYNNGLEFIPFFILIFNIVFNFLVHKKFTNYVSLLFSITILLFLFYSLFFLLFEYI